MIDEIRVYDICKYVNKKYPQFSVSQNLGLIVGNNKFIITDNEAVHHVYNIDEIINITIFPADEIDKANRTTTIFLTPCGTMKFTLAEFEKIPSRKIKMDDFFDRRNYNQRLSFNYEHLLKSIEDININNIQI